MLVMANDDHHDDNTTTWFLWEPRTLFKITLPSLNDLDLEGDYSLVLSSSPLSDDCLLLFVDTPRHLLHFCSLGPEEPNWNSCCVDGAIVEDFDEFVSFNGNFCAKSKFGNGIVFITYNHHGPLQIIMHSNTVSNESWICGKARKLVESCGELFLVSLLPGSIIVYKLLHFPNIAWERVNDIGVNRVFLLDQSVSVSCSAVELGLFKGNCICFTTITNSAAFMYVFDMDKGTLMEDHQRIVPLHYPDFGSEDRLDAVFIPPAGIDD